MVSAVVLLLAVLPAVLAKAVPIDLETVNFESLGPYVEGDMILTEDQKNGIPGDNYRWPNGIIYYRLEGGFASNSEYQQLIQNAKADIESKTCLRLVEDTSSSQSDYVAVTDASSGCSSYIGRIGGRQQLNLAQPGCSRIGTAVHEFLHASGFYHEHTRPDRDTYVTINWNNIEPGKENNFDIRSNSLTFGETYDYGSVLHYSKTSFSVNGENTIDTVDPNATVGQRVEMSATDAAKVNSMYNC